MHPMLTAAAYCSAQIPEEQFVGAEPIQPSETDAELERRLTAEREFHNRKFGDPEEHGSPQSIYALPKAAYRSFERELRSRAAGAEARAPRPGCRRAPWRGPGDRRGARSCRGASVR